jgi:hypothetical protein
METARSAAGRRKARKFRKHKQAAAMSLFVACLDLLAYVPLVWHSEPSILILIRKSELGNMITGAGKGGCFRGKGR